MKKLVTILIFISTLIIFAQEQDDEEEIEVTTIQKNVKNIFIGPMVSQSMGLSVVSTPVGRQNGLGFGSTPNLSFIGVLPLMKDIDFNGITMLEYDNLPYQIKDFNTGQKYNHNIAYATLTAMLDFEGMLLGISYGMPISASNGNDIDINKIQTLSELKLGGRFNILEDEKSRFDMTLTVGYMLNGMFDNYPNNDPLKQNIPMESNQRVSNSFNPRVARINLGFSYLFNAGKLSF
jgi:hypothetical protein